MPRTKETVHHKAFTDEELQILWANKDDETVRMILVMCYSGFRISEYVEKTFEVHLEDPVPYFKGGMKTEAGKSRIVPIHSSILPLVREMNAKEKGVVFFSGKSTVQFRRDMKAVLEKLGLPVYTPHSTRHTFSRLCESYEVREADRKRMLGHSLKSDITNGVYGHRSVEELKREIEKIK